MNDIGSGVYYAVRAPIDGENSYDRERFLLTVPTDAGFPPYAPITLLLHLPLGILPPAPAQAAYGIFTNGLTLLLALVALRVTGLQDTVATVFLLAGFLLLTRPGFIGTFLRGSGRRARAGDTWPCSGRGDPR